jgi:hypothetical protein
VSGSLVADLGITPEVWLILTLLSCLTLFFKFSRFWSVRNLDLLLLFALAPGMLALVGNGSAQPWIAFVWLFIGSALWLLRCLLDLGLSRRPLLEPNLNGAGLACLAVGVLGLLLAETVHLSAEGGPARNPADPRPRSEEPPPPVRVGPSHLKVPVEQVLKQAPLPSSLKMSPPQVVLSRILAMLAHLGLVGGLLFVGARHFERPIAGLAVATCYLILPYTRIALVDCGQVIPAALIVAALAVYDRPAAAGALIGLAGGWMPACLGLIPLWAGFYWRRGVWRFLATALAVVVACGLLGLSLHVLAAWARALGARSLAQAGMLPGVGEPLAGSFWAGIDSSFRLPVLVFYLALVCILTLWPAEKNLGELIALSAALLIASQFWYLEEGGTLILLYLPLILLMMFRPNLGAKRPITRPPKSRRMTSMVPEV